ncbi:uncharacterized protein LOC133819706 [Humulus lupulus]|uniref:uncharacterized protein LOC133819706 n=1 Tax=Humulus lupulus TaxID=3486 RepID=UPI002B406AB6|nr:uncharacterized protein LOC133819706 [Humulus lupulus]
MQEITVSSPASPPPTTAAAATTKRHGDRGNVQTTSLTAKQGCLSFLVSLKEGYHYFKASIFGLTKKATARNEREATEAELRAEKMQVEAADAAEDAKAKIHKSA